MPNRFNLSQNYPNPFNPITTINYSIPELSTKNYSNVLLTVYNMLGSKVEVLVDERKEAGEYQVKFNAVNFSSGICFYTLKAGSFEKTRKMILLR